MSLRFYQTMVLVMLLGPIQLQAYFHFERPDGTDDQAPLTIQEAQEIKNFYTSVERDLLENLEILSDGTHQVTFSENVNVLLGMGMATQMVSGDFGGDPDAYSKGDRKAIRAGIMLDAANDEKWQYNNRVLKVFFRDKPYASIKENYSTFTIDIEDPRKEYGIVIKRERARSDLHYETNRVYYFRRVNRNWVRARRYTTFELGSLDSERIKGLRYVNTLVNSLRSDDPSVFANYLKARKIRWTGRVFARRVINTGRFVGRWTFRAILAGAGIVGSQMLFDYAQENHPEETALIIAITKEQWDNLVVAVREKIAELSEDPTLDELEF